MLVQSPPCVHPFSPPSARFCVYPIGTNDDSMSSYTATCARIVANSGMNHEVNAMGTIVEGFVWFFNLFFCIFFLFFLTVRMSCTWTFWLALFFSISFFSCSFFFTFVIFTVVVTNLVFFFVFLFFFRLY